MKDKKINHSSKRNPEENSYARLTGVTFEVLSLNLGIILGGYYLDVLAESSPWILIFSIVLSVAATIYYLLKKFGS